MSTHPAAAASAAAAAAAGHVLPSLPHAPPGRTSLHAALLQVSTVSLGIANPSGPSSRHPTVHGSSDSFRSSDGSAMGVHGRPLMAAAAAVALSPVGHPGSAGALHDHGSSPLGMRDAPGMAMAAPLALNASMARLSLSLGSGQAAGGEPLADRRDALGSGHTMAHGLRCGGGSGSGSGRLGVAAPAAGDWCGSIGVAVAGDGVVTTHGPEEAPPVGTLLDQFLAPAEDAQATLQAFLSLHRGFVYTARSTPATRPLLGGLEYLRLRVDLLGIHFMAPDTGPRADAIVSLDLERIVRYSYNHAKTTFTLTYIDTDGIMTEYRLVSAHYLEVIDCLGQAIVFVIRIKSKEFTERAERAAALSQKNGVGGAGSAGGPPGHGAELSSSSHLSQLLQMAAMSQTALPPSGPIIVEDMPPSPSEGGVSGPSPSSPNAADLMAPGVPSAEAQLAKKKKAARRSLFGSLKLLSSSGDGDRDATAAKARKPHLKKTPPPSSPLAASSVPSSADPLAPPTHTTHEKVELAKYYMETRYKANGGLVNPGLLMRAQSQPLAATSVAEPSGVSSQSVSPMPSADRLLSPPMPPCGVRDRASDGTSIIRPDDEQDADQVSAMARPPQDAMPEVDMMSTTMPEQRYLRRPSGQQSLEGDPALSTDGRSLPAAHAAGAASTTRAWKLHRISMVPSELPPSLPNATPAKLALSTTAPPSGTLTKRLSASMGLLGFGRTPRASTAALGSDSVHSVSPSENEPTGDPVVAKNVAQPSSRESSTHGDHGKASRTVLAKLKTAPERAERLEKTATFGQKLRRIASGQLTLRGAKVSDRLSPSRSTSLAHAFDADDADAASPSEHARHQHDQPRASLNGPPSSHAASAARFHAIQLASAHSEPMLADAQGSSPLAARPETLAALSGTVGKPLTAQGSKASLLAKERPRTNRLSAALTATFRRTKSRHAFLEDVFDGVGVQGAHQGSQAGLQSSAAKDVHGSSGFESPGGSAVIPVERVLDRQGQLYMIRNATGDPTDVIAAAVDSLVETLLLSTLDARSSFQDILMLTFRHVMTPLEFLQQLHNRYEDIVETSLDNGLDATVIATAAATATATAAPPTPIAASHLSSTEMNRGPRSGSGSDHGLATAMQHASSPSVRTPVPVLDVRRRRILGVVKRWVAAKPLDFVDPRARAALESLLGLAVHSGSAVLEELAEQVISILTFELSPRDEILDGYHLPDDLIIPVPLSPAQGERMRQLLVQVDLTALSAKRLAQQLTYVDSKLFRRIPLEEFADFLWADPSPGPRAATGPPGPAGPGAAASTMPVRCRHIKRYISRFNQIAFWVSTVICSYDDQKRRVDVLEKFIKIAHHCLQLQNFNAVMAIWSGLNTTPVMRLKRTFMALSTKGQAQLAQLETLLSYQGNYKRYRELERHCKAPMVPFFGLLLKDLTFMNDGNQKTLPNGLLNFEKLRLIYTTISNVRPIQRVSFSIALDTGVLDDPSAALSAQSATASDLPPEITCAEYCLFLPHLDDMTLLRISKTIEQPLNAATGSAAAALSTPAPATAGPPSTTPLAAVSAAATATTPLTTFSSAPPLLPPPAVATGSPLMAFPAITTPTASTAPVSAVEAAIAYAIGTRPGPVCGLSGLSGASAAGPPAATTSSATSVPGSATSASSVVAAEPAADTPRDRLAEMNSLHGGLIINDDADGAALASAVLPLAAAGGGSVPVAARMLPAPGHKGWAAPQESPATAALRQSHAMMQASIRADPSGSQ
ncbi:hypothetical protein CXG81DRAFT_17181 [Caulochytrium protostelioides]|uniref:Ras GEF n=1 Tax=Caulochytrium protostelioides TaxID=1555241 RepID=A0A4P9XCN7_9FUNG|nr:hypothetical protein CXG81DRAFT_17181 [Caulochytrium protostelioides]|eukprot:RKP03224.1 hypothetical protein CXG81DRAFT_17181 [Caulochytrium protostelioides]